MEKATPQPRGSVAVVLDSVAAMPTALAQQHHISVVPLTVIFGETPYKDGVDLTPTQFYRMLRAARQLPTTAGATPGQYLAVFRELGQWAVGILCVTVATELSVTHSSAVKAAEELRDVPVEVVDSRSACMAEGFVALVAARAAQAGKTLPEVAALAREAVPQVHLFMALDTLEYLRRGGRVSVPAAWMASLLEVKPILCLQNGTPRLFARVRTRVKALERLLDTMKEQVGDHPVFAAVHHADALEEAQALMEKVRATFTCRELYLAEFTPVMGTHAGPGVVGVCWYCPGRA